MFNRQREVVEGPRRQGIAESVVYTLDVSAWGTDPSAVVVTVYDSAGTDVTGTKTTGLPSVLNPTTIQLPIIHSLSAAEYRVTVKFDIGGNTLEAWFTIEGEV